MGRKIRMYRRVHLRERQRQIDAENPRPRKVKRKKAEGIQPPEKW